MNIDFIIDSAESGPGSLSTLFKDIAIIKKLDVGDVMFVVDNKPFILIERKTSLDLASSLHDKRYKEQKFRLKSFREKNPGVYIVYLVEDFRINNKKEYVVRGDGIPTSIPKNTILSIITKTLFRDNMYCVVTQNINETSLFLEKIYENLKKNAFTLDTTNAKDDYLSEIFIEKKRNITPKDYYKVILAQVPGMSIKKASKIVQIYPSLLDLISAYEMCDTLKEKQELLKNIKIDGRNLGPACSKKIYHFITTSDIVDIKTKKSKPKKPKPKPKKQSSKKQNVFMILDD